MRSKPTYEQPLIERSQTASSYYRFFTDLDIGTPPAAEATIVITASPFTYVAPRGGSVIVSGGTVSQIQFARTKGAPYVTGQTAGMFSVGFGDMLIVTYSGVPTMTFVPL